MLVRLAEKAAGAARRVEHGFSELRVRDRNHELHDRTRRVELAGIAGRIPHLAEHGFVQVTECVYLFRRVEMDTAHLVDHVAQEVSGLHAIGHAAEDVGDDFLPALAGGRLESTQIGEETGAAFAVRSDGFVLVDEGE